MGRRPSNSLPCLLIVTVLIVVLSFKATNVEIFLTGRTVDTGEDLATKKVLAGITDHMILLICSHNSVLKGDFVFEKFIQSNLIKQDSKGGAGINLFVTLNIALNIANLIKKISKLLIKNCM